MTPTEFEILTQKLFAKRLKKELGYDVPVYHQKEYQSLSGNIFQIDVSYSFKILDIEYLTFVECKFWNSYVTREKVGYFKSILDDLKIHKGILITSKGFQSGAVSYAQSQNIGLIKVTNDKDFETISNFDGAIDDIIKLFISKDNLDFKNSFTTFGLFTPKSSVIEYISMNYGIELGLFLQQEFLPEILDDPNFKLDINVKKQLLKIPENWHKNYTNIATCGLNYKLYNESELRILNLILYALKYK